MQYIDGASLGSLAGELTLEQKLVLVRGAVEGIQEAHRAGIIHRDIKPSNIMVERTADGALKPYVMDFGLARAVAEDGQTLSGAVVGTPRYMAPEQANGGPGDLDRRADIYSMGATLYHLLTGQPPIPGHNLMEVMHNLSTMEPRPLRAIDPSIPADLEAIVMKSIEKDRTARYDSARALGDDLDRFLAGEPVTARSAGAWYRLRKRLAKHRRLIAVAAVALIAVSVAIGWAIETRLASNERERLARRFTESVERIEAMARYSALSPVHDIRGDQAALRAQMAQLEAEIRGAGSVAVGPGHYALGRGYLALDDDAAARVELEAAWQAGFREPRVAYALALVMGHLYKQHLRAVDRIDSKQLRETKKREIERQYRDPALSYLAASKGSEIPSTEYVAALVAFYEDHLDEALRHVDAIGGGLPWFYEALALRGDILLARTAENRRLGDRDGARLDVEAGRKAYAAAIAAGQSVASVYASLAELEYAGMLLELYGAGDVTPSFERVIAAAGRAITVMPGYYDALVLETRAYRSLAEYKANHGSNIDDLLAKAIAAAEQAIAVAHDRPLARIQLATVYRQWAESRQAHNDDPTEQLRKSVAIFDDVLAADRDDEYYMAKSLVFTVWADYLDQRSADSSATRGQAIDVCLRAVQIDPQVVEAWINLGTNYFKRASAPHAADPDGDLRQAIGALEKAKSIDPKHIIPYFYEGEAYDLVSQRQRARGFDPRPDVARSLEVYRAGLAINSKIPHLYNGIGIVLLAQAGDAWDRGEASEPILDQAKLAFDQAMTVAPDQGFAFTNAGEVQTARARYQQARDEDPGASVSAAVELLHRALERMPDHFTIWGGIGAAYVIQSRYELDHGRDPRPAANQALAAIDKSLQHGASDAPSQRHLGEARGVLAQWHALEGHPATAEFEQAAQALQRAVDLAPDDQDSQLALGALYHAWAVAERDAKLASQRGLAIAAQLLASRPNWAAARALHGGMLLARAQQTTDGSERRGGAATAADELSRALANNPNLKVPWQARLALAQRLATAP
jgi:serine/threonine-protein kinase